MTQSQVILCGAGTFQLVWNDLKNEYAKKDIEFDPQIEIAKNLNKSDFTEDMLSEDSYYKKTGEMTKKLKEEIEKEIKEKFNETSSILDTLEWKDKTENILLYAMLKKQFEFENEFDKLDNGIFNEKYENIRFFGVNQNSNSETRNQINVIYYNDMEDFALSINTKQNDQVIIYKTSETKNFSDTYEELNKKADNYNGEKAFGQLDTFKMPEIKVATKRGYVELLGKQFLFANGETREISEAIQTIEFELNNKGGEIKSEAAMGISKTANRLEDSRKFIVDGTFYLFLKENEKEKPYFAARIDDVTKFQK